MNHVLISNRNFVLRKVLNTEENIDIIKDIIEAFLNIKIKSIFLNTYLDEKYLPIEEKFGVTDVRIITDKNEEFNIGIQFLDGQHIQTKIALYYLYVHTNQIHYNDERTIAKTITINFMDFPYYKSFGYHKRVILNKFKKIDFKEEEAESHIIEIQKFHVSYINNMTREEQWITCLKDDENNIKKKIKEENVYIKKLDKAIYKYWEEEKI